MKLDPGFISHWKTELLIADLGAEGVIAILRLWGNAQIKRQYSGLVLTPRRLAMETKWKGDENHLFSVLTDPDAPWLDQDDDGTFSIHGFNEHQNQIVKLWTLNPNGRGGKVSPKPSSKDTSSSSSSSSYPNCQPNGNHMVSEEQGKEGAALPEVVPTGRKFPDHEAIKAKIRGLKPEWARPVHWGASELHHLHSALGQFEELTDADWELLRRYLSAHIEKGAAFFQPYNREKFVESFSGVFSAALRWEGKRRPTPSVPKPSAPIPERKILTRAEMAEMMKP